jgi:V/A-type H+-transporting ATPase subunit A
VGYCCRSDGARLLSEVIRVRGRMADLQVFEETRGLRVGDPVEVEDAMLSVTLGPGLLGEVYDGLQNPLWELAGEAGFFLKPGTYIPALSTERKWDFTPTVAPGATVEAGTALGWVPEGIFKHLIMVPFSWQGRFTVDSIVPAGAYPIDREIAVLKGETNAPTR